MTLQKASNAASSATTPLFKAVCKHAANTNDVAAKAPALISWQVPKAAFKMPKTIKEPTLAEMPNAIQSAPNGANAMTPQATADGKTATAPTVAAVSSLLSIHSPLNVPTSCYFISGDESNVLESF